MVKIILGVKGTGKTKTLIDMVNSTAQASAGSVVCIEQGEKLRYDVSYQVRLVNTAEYSVADAQSLYGFIAGIHASNHDITHIFVDSALKVAGNDMAAFDKFLAEADSFCTANNIDLVMTVSLPVEQASETIKKFI